MQQHSKIVFLYCYETGNKRTSQNTIFTRKFVVVMWLRQLFCDGFNIEVWQEVCACSIVQGSVHFDSKTVFLKWILNALLTQRPDANRQITWHMKSLADRKWCSPCQWHDVPRGTWTDILVAENVTLAGKFQLRRRMRYSQGER